MADPSDAALADLVAAVRQGARGKYRPICTEVIATIGARELVHRRSLAEAVKATRGKLHQIGGAYFAGPPSYDAWLASLQATDSASRRDACRDIMRQHLSTRARLPFLDHFFTTALAGLPPIQSVLDVACGLNPLALSWMPLAEGAVYHACDIYEDLAAFLNAAFPLLGVTGHATTGDVTQTYPTQRVDLALILKALPCFAQIDPSSSVRLLNALNAPFVLVSFPTLSLGGHSRGMPTTYEARIRAIAADQPWQIARFAFPTELVFLISKSVPS